MGSRRVPKRGIVLWLMSLFTWEVCCDAIEIKKSSLGLSLCYVDSRLMGEEGYWMRDKEEEKVSKQYRRCLICKLFYPFRGM